MAQYTQRVNAIDSYQRNWQTEEITRLSVMEANTQYRFNTNGSEYPFKPDILTEIYNIYPERVGIDKKRYMLTEYYAYVQDRKTNVSYSLPYGSSWVFGLSNDNKDYNFYTSYGIGWRANYIDATDLQIGSYNKFNSPIIGTFVGTSYAIGSNVNYRVGNMIKTYSHDSSYPSYAIHKYEDVIPFASSRTPSKFLDKKVPTTFSWVFDYDKANVTGVLKQVSAKLRYRNKGDASYTEIAITGETSSHIAPANTFTANDVEWQVIVTSDDGATSTQSDWLTLTTIDSVPSCEVKYPNGTFIDGAKANVFAWSHIIDTGSPQTKYELQYSIDGANWLALSTETTSRQNFTVQADIFPAGNIQWRARTYNTDNVVSTWSVPANVVVRSAPPIPSILSIDNKARPTIKWGAVGQEAFRIIINNGNVKVYESSVIASKEKQYKIPTYLNDGTYSFKLYVLNVYGLESQPYIGTINVLTDKIGGASVTYENIDNAVKFKISLSPSTPKAYILRNGVPIKKITNSTEWIDYNASGSNTYLVRSIDINDNFADTPNYTIDVPIKHAVIAPIYDTSFMLELVLTREEPLTQSGRIELIGDSQYFSGREYPVFTFSQQKSETKPLEYTFRTVDEFNKFKQIINLKQTIIYRNNRGEVFYGVVYSYEYFQDKLAIDVSFNLIKVSYNEQIDYDMEV